MFIVAAMHGIIIHLCANSLIGAEHWCDQVTPNSETRFCATGFM